MMKQIASLLLSLSLVMGLAACTTGQQPVEEPEPDGTVLETAYTPGTYTATATSMKGPLTLTVTVSESEITSLDIVSCEDTPGIAGVAIEQVAGRILKEQSLAVDITSGATMTSRAILVAAEDALSQAGGDIAALKDSDGTLVPQEKADEEVDVVIVGSGGAGLSAAIAASRDSGLKVLVLEKLDYIGGSTGVAGGGIWTIGSEFNKRSGVDSNAEDLIAFMEMRSGTELNRELLANVAAVAGPTFDYLLENDFPIIPDYYGKGHPDSNLSTASMDSGDGDYETGAGGRLIVNSLAELVDDNGGEIRLGGCCNRTYC